MMGKSKIRFGKLILGNSCVLALLFSFYGRGFMDGRQEIPALLFAVPYFWSHAFLLTAIWFLPWFVAGKVWRHNKWVQELLALCTSFLLVVVYIDLFVYRQYRFHLNFFVLDLFFHPGGQIIHFPFMTWLALLILFGITYFLEKALLRFSQKVGGVSGFRKNLFCAFLGFAGTHVAHAIADGLYYHPITEIARIPPLAAPLQDQDLLSRWGIVDVERHKLKSLAESFQTPHQTIHYPLEPLRFGPLMGQLPNVLVIVVDSLRFDLLQKDVMPHLTGFAEKASTFYKHYSGGNATRAGIFSLFYGLVPHYFEAFRQAHSEPVLMAQFRRHDYEMKILASAPLTKPEFDQTVFSKIKGLRLRSKSSLAFERDREITDEWLKFTKSLPSSARKPFFGFLFYDSAHDYSYDKKYEKFRPILEDINYLALDNSTDPTPFFNRYKNSVHFIDHLLGEVFLDLEQRELLQDTIVLVTSDHGQEFNDNGLNFWGHNSNFTDVQTRVPLVLHWPGKIPKQFHRTTSHYDVPATFLEGLFNCKNDPSSYSSGENLWKGEGHDWLLQGTYNDYAIRMPDHLVVIQNTGGYAIYDERYRIKRSPRLDFATYRRALLEMRRFLK